MPSSGGVDSSGWYRHHDEIIQQPGATGPARANTLAVNASSLTREPWPRYCIPLVALIWGSGL